MNPDMVDLFLRVGENKDSTYRTALIKKMESEYTDDYSEDTNKSETEGHKPTDSSLSSEKEAFRATIKSVVKEMILDGEIELGVIRSTKQTNEGYSYDEEVVVLGISEPDAYPPTWQDARYGYVIKSDRPENSW